MLKKIVWIVFVFFAIIIGLYPIIYLFFDRNFGLLSTKSNILLNELVWNICFYLHIAFASIALLIGWIQFDEKRRKKTPKRHRNIGKIYIISVLLSGLASLYIGCFATGGLIASIGFLTLGIIWMGTTIIALLKAKNKQFSKHRQFMVYSYAACFAGVTLRLWLPLLTFVMGSFIPAYQLVAWLCWVPNLMLAYLICNSKFFKNQSLI